MLVLGLETATPWGSLALIDDEETVFEITLNAGKGGGEYLLSMLDKLLSRSARQIGDIGLIAVGIGPGSYTGIRVGLAAAKGLAEGLNIPARGINTLRIMAENARYSSEWVAPVIDARRGEVYAALYQSAGGELLEIESPMVVPVGSFAIRLAGLPGVLISGNGSRVYREAWMVHSNLQIGPPDWDRPHAAAAARIGRREFDPEQPGDLMQLSPSYLRRVEAETRWEEGQCNSKSNR